MAVLILTTRTFSVRHYCDRGGGQRPETPAACRQARGPGGLTGQSTWAQTHVARAPGHPCLFTHTPPKQGGSTHYNIKRTLSPLYITQVSKSFSKPSHDFACTHAFQLWIGWVARAPGGA